MASIKSVIEAVANNTIGSKVSFSTFSNDLSAVQCDELAKALCVNTTVTSVDLCRKGLQSAHVKGFTEVLKLNKTITLLDLGYNKISGKAIVELCNALHENTSLTEMKIHRQEQDYGSSCETEIVKLWDKNTTLVRLYATLHSRTCNRANTSSEVRNKEISNRKQAGRPWRDLDPDPVVRAEYKVEEQEKRDKVAADLAATNAPISEKVASTGGPYTLKQLTCASEFIADDVEKTAKEQHLSDEEFLSVFAMTKEKFGSCQKWKQNGLKKNKNL